MTTHIEHNIHSIQLYLCVLDENLKSRVAPSAPVYDNSETEELNR
jgi:hypothetical protein